MSNGRIHHYTVRVNTDSFVGRKVIAALEQMKASSGMSYNACFQESVLMMSEGTELPGPVRPGVRKKEKDRDNATGSESLSVSAAEGKPPVTKTAEAGKEGEEELSNEDMLSLLGDTFSEDFY